MCRQTDRPVDVRRSALNTREADIFYALQTDYCLQSPRHRLLLDRIVVCVLCFDFITVLYERDDVRTQSARTAQVTSGNNNRHTTMPAATFIALEHHASLLTLC